MLCILKRFLKWVSGFQEIQRCITRTHEMRNRILTKRCLPSSKIYQLPEYYTMFAWKIFFSPEFGGGGWGATAAHAPLSPHLLCLWLSTVSCHCKRSFAVNAIPWFYHTFTFIPLAGWEINTSQRAVMLCSWRVKWHNFGQKSGGPSSGRRGLRWRRHRRVGKGKRERYSHSQLGVFGSGRIIS